MPKEEYLQELVSNCTYKGMIQNDVDGILVTGPNGNSIFLPKAGLRSGQELYGRENGYYWSSTGDNIRTEYAYYLYFSTSGYNNLNSYLHGRADGHSVRPDRN